jgi:23S rRNA (adenine2503-C2)-methyltransferase
VSDPAPTRYGISRPELAELLDSWGQAPYRTAQVWDGLYRRRAPLEELTDLGKSLRGRLAEALPYALEPCDRTTGDGGDTVKWLWTAPGSANSHLSGGSADPSSTPLRRTQVETVLMVYADRATVCVSSQAGCAMGCTFCATGQAGFDRHLSAAEIVEQVVRAAHASPRRVSNVVFMGMGEPLANYDATWEALVRLHHDLGISARHLTVSTVGVPPGMRRLADGDLPVTLAVSLHAPDDALRDTLVPLNRRYPLAEVLDAARHYLAARGRRLSFEYALMAGVNDRLEQADALARLVGGLGAHVNLIPLNPTPGFPVPGSPPHQVAGFAERLRRRGVNATVRRNRGTDIDAACGQLRSRHQVVKATAVSVAGSQ